MLLKMSFNTYPIDNQFLWSFLILHQNELPYHNHGPVRVNSVPEMTDDYLYLQTANRVANALTMSVSRSRIIFSDKTYKTLDDTLTEIYHRIFLITKHLEKTTCPNRRYALAYVSDKPESNHRIALVCPKSAEPKALTPDTKHIKILEYPNALTKPESGGLSITPQLSKEKAVYLHTYILNWTYERTNFNPIVSWDYTLPNNINL